MKLYRLLWVVLVTGAIFVPTYVNAEGLVTGRYLQETGKEVAIELEISSPPPPLVIVIQNLPQGIKIVASDPEMKTYDPGTGEAKWLLSNVASGKMRISLQIDRPVKKGEISGEIRFRNEAGQMASIALKN